MKPEYTMLTTFLSQRQRGLWWRCFKFGALRSYCFFQGLLEHSLASYSASSLHSPFSKDTTEANENWLEDPLRQLKWPLRPVPSSFRFYFRSRHLRYVGIRSRATLNQVKILAGWGDPASSAEDKTWQEL